MYGGGGGGGEEKKEVTEKSLKYNQEKVRNAQICCPANYPAGLFILVYLHTCLDLLNFISQIQPSDQLRLTSTSC